MDKIVLYGIQIDSFNRGVGALTYGHIELLKKSYEFDIIYSLILGKGNSQKNKIVNINNKQINFIEIKFDWKLFLLVILQMPFFKLFGLTFNNNVLVFFKDVDIICANNGGDSYSDIYGLKRLFLEFISIIIPELMGLKVIFTPQTIGPFNTLLGKIMGAIPLLLAAKIFTRDKKGDKFLNTIGKKSIRTRDVSTFMQPQKVDYTVKQNTIGININGLMWENTYDGLENCFDNYKILLKQLVDKLLEQNYNILLIPHTYSITEDFCENDYKAILQFIQNYKDESKVTYLNQEYLAPELKYIISQCDFFIGSRMHSNLAALTTSTPTAALSYSYKFEGTFKMFNVEECVINAKDMENNEIPQVIDKILNLINEKSQIKDKLQRINKNVEEFSFL